jgi:hypothetical protein
VPSGVESRRARAPAALIALLTATLATSTVARAAEPAPTAPPAAPTRQAPTRQEILTAVEKLRTDPNLGVSQKKRILRFNNSNPDRPKGQATASSGLRWIGDAFGWVASTARILVWVMAILLAGILGLVIKRLIDSRGERIRPVAFSMPTHVQDLDIRPESLPDDIGGAALDLWGRGEHRAALALLYRGLLSRLAHTHGVPIRDSSTEGDCLVLAAARLSPQPAAYTTQLVRLWQRAVYGQVDPSEDEFRALSAGFAAAVERAG